MLSLNQKKILKLLAINARYSNKDIAKIVGISEDSVRYQINKLITDEKKGFFSVFFPFSHLGFYTHHYLIRLKNVELSNLEEICSIKEVFFINKSVGKYDLQLIICHRNDEELLKAKEKIDSILKDNIDESLLIKFFQTYKWTNVLLGFNIDLNKPSLRKNPVYSLNKEDWHSNTTVNWPEVKFNEGEKKTIKELLKNARASYSEIGKNTNQSYETIRQQIYKFVEKKYISSFSLMPNYAKFNLFTSYFLISLKNINREKIAKYVQSRDRIFYAAELIGKYNLIVYISSQKPADIHQEVFSLRKLLKDSVIDFELMSFDETLKSIQFPEVLLD